MDQKNNVDLMLVQLTCRRAAYIAQSVTCLTTDVCLSADPVVASYIPAWSHDFVEIGHEIMSTVILLPSAEFVNRLFNIAQENVWLGELTVPS